MMFLYLKKKGFDKTNSKQTILHGVLPPERKGGKYFGVMGGLVKLDFEWELIYMGAYRKAINWENFTAFSEEIGNYVGKLNQ